MPAATLTRKGQIIIPADIRARYGLTPGTQVEFVEENEGIRVVCRRRVAQSDPAAGYGLFRVKPASPGKRRLSHVDTAASPRRTLNKP